MVDYLTRADVATWGNDLLDVAQRASVHALGPALQQIQADNAELRQRLAKEARFRLDQEVKAAVPNLSEWDQDPRWHEWLRSRDLLSGRIRQSLLDEAIASGSSQRVLAVFRAFHNQLTGRTASSASGRAAPSGTAVYTRPQIQAFYAAHRKGAYVGREAEFARIEQDIIAAGRENRIHGGLDPSGGK
jgi:hypothetical protein